MDEMMALSGADFLRACWKEKAESVIDAISAEDLFTGNYDDFLSHCTACGGNWGGMLLTGINDLWPRVYNAIPDEMGAFAWACLCEILNMLGVHNKE